MIGWRFPEQICKMGLIMKTMMVLMFIGLAFLVYAEDYYSNDELTIEEFILLDNSTLNYFNVEFLEVENVMNDYIYHFNINLYLDYFDGENLWITPSRVEHTFECNIDLDCSTEYTTFIEEYQDWWMTYYQDLKGDYT